MKHDEEKLQNLKELAEEYPFLNLVYPIIFTLVNVHGSSLDNIPYKDFKNVLFYGPLFEGVFNGQITIRKKTPISTKMLLPMIRLLYKYLIRQFDVDLFKESVTAHYGFEGDIYSEKCRLIDFFMHCYFNKLRPRVLTSSIGDFIKKGNPLDHSIYKNKSDKHINSTNVGLLAIFNDRDYLDIFKLLSYVKSEEMTDVSLIKNSIAFDTITYKVNNLEYESYGGNGDWTGALHQTSIVKTNIVEGVIGYGSLSDPTSDDEYYYNNVVYINSNFGHLPHTSYIIIEKFSLKLDGVFIPLGYRITPLFYNLEYIFLPNTSSLPTRRSPDTVADGFQIMSIGDTLLSNNEIVQIKNELSGIMPFRRS